ncbi:UNVERIFIED_CONTAM: hypothetical protein HDU68_006092 [Siphonaria sp. JEL0065]|nr:hypothetical protein HDU68_006092 [Siphonaria sp. JEL0065]
MGHPRPSKGFHVMPYALPILGNLQTMQSTFSANAAKYGALWLRFPSFLFPESMLHCESPELVKQVLTQLDCDSAWPERWKKLLGMKSIVVASGDSHKRLRALSSQAIKKTKIQSSLPQLRMLAQDALTEIAMASSTCATGISPLISVCQAFLVQLDLQFYDLFKELLILVNGLGDFFIPEWFPFSPIRKGLAARQKMMDVVLQVIQERRIQLQDETVASAMKDGLTSFLLSADASNDSALSDEEIADTVISMFFAGTETTASSITTVIHVLLHEISSEELDSLQQELSVYAFGQGPELLELPILDALIKETFRKYTTAPGGWRRLASDAELDGIQLPKGTLFSVSYERGYAHVSPDAFKLGRFLGENAFDKIHPNEYIPFGAGPRMCLGQNLARAEMKVFISELIHGFDLKKGKTSKKQFLPTVMMEPFIKLSEKGF